MADVWENGPLSRRICRVLISNSVSAGVWLMVAVTAGSGLPACRHITDADSIVTRDRRIKLSGMPVGEAVQPRLRQIKGRWGTVCDDGVFASETVMRTQCLFALALFHAVAAAQERPGQGMHARAEARARANLAPIAGMAACDAYNPMHGRGAAHLFDRTVELVEEAGFDAAGFIARYDAQVEDAAAELAAQVRDAMQGLDRPDIDGVTGRVHIERACFARWRDFLTAYRDTERLLSGQARRKAP